MLRAILALSATAALLALAFCLFAVGTAALQIRDMAAGLPKLAQDEAAATRQAAQQSIQSALTAAQTEIKATRNVLDARLASVEATAASEVQEQGRAILGAVDARMAQALSDLDTQLRQANASLAEATALAPPIRGVVETFDRQFMQPTIVVADGTTRGNPGALYPRWLALSGEAMRTSDSIRLIAEAQAKQAPAQSEAMTALAQNIAGITSDVHKVTTEYTRPRKWHEKLWGGMKAIGGLAVLAAK